MSKIYWFTVLGSLGTISFIIAIIALVAFVLLAIACIVIGTNDYESSCFEPVKKSMIASGVVALFFGFSCCFIPSKKDLYLIYGAGTIIDYCQDNSKVTEISDKAVEALNTWLDMINEEKEK